MTNQKRGLSEEERHWLSVEARNAEQILAILDAEVLADVSEEARQIGAPRWNPDCVVYEVSCQIVKQGGGPDVLPVRIIVLPAIGSPD